MSVAGLLDGKHVCICAGSGGVGKTTTAAAVAMGMAARGLRVAVLTIDPARRLANSLGLPELGNEECRIEPALFEEQGLEMRGELWAMMLDAKRTWDELIERRAPDAKTRDAVLGNRIYQELSNAVSGSSEYMAIEKLYELHEEGRYDLLVLDTPPTRNALDFLEAPDRLTRFIDSRSLSFFLKPGLFGVKAFGRGTGLLFSILKRLTGVDLLHDLSEFFASFGDMAIGIRDRAKHVEGLLEDAGTTFLLVTSPRRDAVEEAVFFRRRLRESGMPFGAAIVNRVHAGADTEVSGAEIEPDLQALLGEKLGHKVARNFDDYRTLACRDAENVARLERELRGEPIVRVPLLDDDVHDLGGLAAVNEHLFAGDAVGVA
ncbi:MAG: AAA family ATPase [Actinomycetota bacterium]|nr:AAA family ATPase [Actinomycetota bacterium]